MNVPGDGHLGRRVEVVAVGLVGLAGRAVDAGELAGVVVAVGRGVSESWIR